MTRADAFKILTSDCERIGKIGRQKVVVWPADIKVNIECNDDLELDWIQDFVSLLGELVQGHSLADVRLTC
jgi:hypothetical protein